MMKKENQFKMINNHIQLININKSKKDVINSDNKRKSININKNNHKNMRNGISYLSNKQILVIR